MREVSSAGAVLSLQYQPGEAPAAGTELENFSLPQGQSWEVRAVKSQVALGVIQPREEISLICINSSPSGFPLYQESSSSCRIHGWCVPAASGNNRGLMEISVRKVALLK